MLFLLDIRFEDVGYNALVHLVTTIEANSYHERDLFYNELKAGLLRTGVIILADSCIQIDSDPLLYQRQMEYQAFCVKNSTATIMIEQFQLEKPDQSKNLWDNLLSKMFNGEESTASIGRKYNIPVRVRDKETRNPITHEVYYFGIEHLIPKSAN